MTTVCRPTVAVAIHYHGRAQVRGTVVTLQQKFGNVIRRRRVAAGLSQEKLADLARLHRTYISLLERGQRTPSIEVVRSLASALKTTMTSLIGELEKS